MSPATLRPSRKPDRRNGRHARGWGEASTVPLPESGGEVVLTGCRYSISPGQRFGLWLRVIRISDGLGSPEFFLDAVRPEPEEPAADEGAEAGEWQGSNARRGEDSRRRETCWEAEGQVGETLASPEAGTGRTRRRRPLAARCRGVSRCGSVRGRRPGVIRSVASGACPGARACRLVRSRVGNRGMIWRTRFRLAQSGVCTLLGARGAVLALTWVICPARLRSGRLRSWLGDFREEGVKVNRGGRASGGE